MMQHIPATLKSGGCLLLPRANLFLFWKLKTEKWETCKRSLSVLNFSSEEADNLLSKAFGWRHSPYWGEERSKEVPKSESVNETLAYLRQLGLSDEDLFKLIKKFPEVLGCRLDDELKVNIGILEKDWGIEGSTLRNLLLRNPKVLGYNVDCKGDCMAQCTRCWHGKCEAYDRLCGLNLIACDREFIRAEWMRQKALTPCLGFNVEESRKKELNTYGEGGIWAVEAINCGSSCAYRCSKASRHKMCIRACNTCCQRCGCVPPGTSGNKDVCPCYANMKTRGGRSKCP